MIREARVEDIPSLVEMGGRFIEETEYRESIKFDAEKLTKLMADHLGGIFVSEVDGRLTGAIGQLIFEHPMSGLRTAVELFWWVNPESRGEGIKLLRRAEANAEAAGAKQMQMVAPNERVAGLYMRLGYKFVESTYSRSLP